MIVKVFIVALLASTQSATSACQITRMNQTKYGNRIVEALEIFKETLKCVPDLKKILDPLTFDNKQYHYDGKDADVAGEIKNLYISGLTNFNIVGKSYDNTTMLSTFDIVFPTLQVLGNIEGAINVTMGPINFVWSDRIVINIKATDIRFVGEYTIGIRNKTDKPYITDFDVQFLIADVKADNWFEHFDIAENKYLNDFIGSFSLLVAKEAQPVINMIVRKIVVEEINNDISEPLDITEIFENLFKTKFRPF